MSQRQLTLDSFLAKKRTPSNESSQSQVQSVPVAQPAVQPKPQQAARQPPHQQKRTKFISDLPWLNDQSYFLQTLIEQHLSIELSAEVVCDLIHALLFPSNDASAMQDVDTDSQRSSQQSAGSAARMYPALADSSLYPSNFLNDVMPNIMKWALEASNLMPEPLQMLRRGSRHSASFSRRQVRSLLALACLCAYPASPEQPRKWWNNINFDTIYRAESDYMREKLRTLLHYFSAESAASSASQSDKYDESVTITRGGWLEDVEDPFTSWSFFTHLALLPGTSHAASYSLRIVDDKSKMEDIASQLHREDASKKITLVDFANKRVGGGVLGRGCVQEEILFLCMPECLVSRLICEELDETECIVIDNVRRISTYDGYSNTYHFVSLCGGEEEALALELLAMDALDFSGRRNGYYLQFLEKYVLRELNKCFASIRESSGHIVITGHWGCGAFQGDKQLKALIQLMSASLVNQRYVAAAAATSSSQPTIDMVDESGTASQQAAAALIPKRQRRIQQLVYCCFGDEDFARDLQNLTTQLEQHQISIGQIYKWIIQYGKQHVLKAAQAQAATTSPARPAQQTTPSTVSASAARPLDSTAVMLANMPQNGQQATAFTWQETSTAEVQPVPAPVPAPSPAPAVAHLPTLFEHILACLQQQTQDTTPVVIE